VRIDLRDRSPVLGDPYTLPAETRAARARWGVALVTMPFASAYWPSMQLGLLGPIATSHGFPTEILHLNLEFAHQLGVDAYQVLAQQRERALGDWLFSTAAFGPAAPDPHGQMPRQLANDIAPVLAQLGLSISELLEVRDRQVPAYLEAQLNAVEWDRFRVVGFTSTFQQNVASIALASMLKRRHPHLVTVFGGANFDGTMGIEYVRAIDCIDYAVTGEADRSFSQLLISLVDGQDPSQVPGVLARDGGQVVGAADRPFEDMDELPVPDYSDYFSRAERLGISRVGGRREATVPFESARGCWWGAKSHCTFCGLNGETMAFRSKSPGRVAAELAELARRNRTFDFQAVDNILDRSYLDELLPQLVADGSTYRLFYEVKANLTRGEVRALRESGVRMIQPGIESLSSHVLRLMRKGVRASTNVNLLKWACYYGLDVGWNMLWGFPGEQTEDYDAVAALMPQLIHLQPPVSATRIRLERFSPLFEDPETFPLAWRRPEASYRYIYPEHVDLEKAAYFFEYVLQDTLPSSVYAETVDRVDEWRLAWAGETRPSLTRWAAPGFIQIDDHRHPDTFGTYTFTDPLAAIYRACDDAPATACDVKERLGLDRELDEVEATLEEFCSRGLMMRDGNLFLSLAIPATGGLSPDAPWPQAL